MISRRSTTVVSRTRSRSAEPGTWSGLRSNAESLHSCSSAARPCMDDTVVDATATAYGRAKLAAERCVLDEGLAAGMHVACLRPPAVYGPGCRGNVLTAIR